MKGLFDLDSPFMRALTKMADLMILNLLVLLTCIPVITVGASITAMHYVLIKMVRNEETYITKMYFKSFKENFVQGTIEWLIMLLVFGILAGDIWLFTQDVDKFPPVMRIGVILVAVIFVMTGMYVFPLQARFVNTIRSTMKNAFLMMVLNLPKSVLMLLLYALPFVLLLLSQVAIPILIMFGVSAPSFGAAYLYRKVFARFEPEEEKITADMDFSVVTDEDITDSIEDTAKEPENEREGSDESALADTDAE